MTGESPQGSASALRAVPPVMPKVADHELLRRVGRGAYGEVWLARSLTGGFRAVKIVHRSFFDHDRPYEREFEGILRFEPISRQHYSQVDILHVGRGDDYFYYVMELADDQKTGGQIDPDNYVPRTLKSDLTVRGRLPFEESVSVALALVEALQLLHERGLVHRDVKPSNIIYVNGIPKLADIGLITSVDATRSFVGTDGFAAPEGAGTPQADLYGLGKVLYETSTGKDRHEFPELPSDLRDYPDWEGLGELNAVITKACRHDPRERYASAVEMRADLELLRSGKSLARLHRAQARLRQLQRVAGIVMVMAAVIAGGWAWQARQTHAMRRLAREKIHLAEENRKRVLSARVANGIRYMQQEDYNLALLWLAEAMPLAGTDRNTEAHRIRLESLLQKTPRLTHLLVHDSRVRHCSFSPDGKWLLGFAGKVARVWDVASGTRAAEDLPHSTELLCLGGFAPDGKHLLTVTGEGQLTLLSSGATWPTLHTRSNVAWADWTPNGEVLVCQTNGPTLLINPSDGEVLRHFNSEMGYAFYGTCSTDGRRLATSTPTGYVEVWDTANGERIEVPIQIHQKLLWRRTPQPPPISFDPTGSRLLICTEPVGDTVLFEMWDTSSGQRLYGPLRPSSGKLHTARLTRDGQRIILVGEPDQAAGTIGTVEVREADSGALVRVLESSISANGARISAAGNLVGVTSWDGFARVWDLDTGKPVTPSLPHNAYVLDLAFSPQGDLIATAGDDAVLKVWKLPGMSGATPEVVLPAHHDHPNALLAVAPRQQHLALASCDGVVNIVDFSDKPKLSALPNPEAATIVHLAWSGDGRWLCGLPGPHKGHPHNGAAARIWDVQIRDVSLLPTGDAPQDSAAISPDGTLAASGTCGGPVQIWNLANRKQPRPMYSFAGHCNTLTFSPDRTKLLGSDVTARVFLWDLTSGRETILKHPHARPVRQLVFSPDGRKFVTVSEDQHARVWDAATGEPVTPFFKHRGVLHVAAWSPGGESLLTAGLAPEARVWDARTGEMVLPFLYHTLGIATASYSPDGRLILTGSNDRTTKIWDSVTGELVIPPITQLEPVKAVSFSANGQVFTACDGRLQIYQLKSTAVSAEALLNYARAVVGQRVDAFEALRPISKDAAASALKAARSLDPDFFR